MNALIVSDLHFTDAPRDNYRWRLFDFLSKTITEHKVKNLLILGDLCEAKDRHTARLVNLVVNSLVALFRQTGLAKISILRGNHDGIDPNMSYFRFLSKFPNIEFIETPFTCEYMGREAVWLPHTTDPVKAWKGVNLSKASYIFMHATVTGAVSENGMQLEGIPGVLLRSARRAKIYSGDVHVSQTIKTGPIEVEYIGAPYPIKFGDAFKPRAILLKDFKTAESIPIDTIRRLMITVTAKDHIGDLAKAEKGDQVKVRVRLAPSEYGDWAELKREVIKTCLDAEVELCGLELEKIATTIKTRPTITKGKTPNQVFNDFCAANKIPADVIAEGRDILQEVP